MAVESYPHIKMGVRDDSIFVGLDTSIMPLDKPIFVMKTQKGDPGVPVWCPSYTFACQKFGTDTFNKRSKYWSEASYFLLKTLVSNGAYIMRVCEEKATEAKVVIECGIRKTDVPQWQRNSITGQFILNDDGSRVPIDAQGQPIKYIDENGKEVTRTLTAAQIKDMEDADPNSVYKYSMSTDAQVVPGKKYFWRDYKVYFYHPFTAEKAVEDCILYFGDLFTAKECKVEITEEEYDALPDDEQGGKIGGWRVNVAPEGKDPVYLYYRDQTLEDIISAPLTAADLTDEVRGDHFIFRKAKGWEFRSVKDYKEGDTWRESEDLYIFADTYTEFVGLTAEEFTKFKTHTAFYTKETKPEGDVYTVADEFESGTTYYVTNDFCRVELADGEAIDPDKHLYKVQENCLVLVTDFSALDPSDNYYFLSWEKWEPKLFAKGDALEQEGIYYSRVPNYAKGYSYEQLVNVTYVMPGVEDPITEPLTPGDKIMGDGSIYHVSQRDSKQYYAGNYGQLYIQGDKFKDGDLIPQGTISGVEIMWRANSRTAEKYKKAETPLDSLDPEQELGFMWYPMLAVSTDNPGKWGESFGFRFYYDKTNNTIAGIASSGAVKYSLAPLELKEGDTTPTAIVDAYGEQTVVGTIRPGVVDPTTDLEVTLKKLVPDKYSGSRELPCTVKFLDSNFAVVGKQLMEAEMEVKDQIKVLYGSLDYWDLDENKEPIIRTFVDELFAEYDAIDLSIEGAGHMANCVSCVAGDKVPYFASHVVGSWDEANNKQNSNPTVIDMSADSQFYLMGGEDGDISDAAIESYIRQSIDACVAGTHDYLIDYLRVPYNNVIDTGVSLKTKKAYLDWMGVRDNLTVFLTPQQLWKDSNGVAPKQLSRYEDESVGASLRSYGLLMREDVENATEANRCIIFLASGINSDHDYANDGLCASTLWVALKNAEYLNTTKIKDEPIERPNSEITCYDGGLTWTAASEETRSRCWNAGLNYAQYAEEGVIHYASCRSIYRYDTSVLCDMGTVRAVTFCKDIIRREWAIWAGSKRPANELNSRITKALNEKCAAMLNGKYTATARVYQTDEDVKYGYVRHVELRLESPATNRVWLATIICAREGFDPSTAEAK